MTLPAWRHSCCRYWKPGHHKLSRRRPMLVAPGTSVTLTCHGEAQRHARWPWWRTGSGSSSFWVPQPGRSPLWTAARPSARLRSTLWRTGPIPRPTSSRSRCWSQACPQEPTPLCWAAYSGAENFANGISTTLPVIGRGGPNQSGAHRTALRRRCTFSVANPGQQSAARRHLDLCGNGFQGCCRPTTISLRLITGTITGASPYSAWQSSP